MLKIYLDYAATAPVRPQIAKKITPFLAEKFGNPSSIHSFGREARKTVDEARENVAKFLNCQPDEVIFTSGGTESDNLAIRGVLAAHSTWQMANSKKRKAKNDKQYAISHKPHLVTSAIEHHAVLHTCEKLEKEKLAEVTYLDVDKTGRVNPENVKKAIKKNTVLVSIMYANNETGTIQPIREIGKIIEKENRQHMANSKSQMKKNNKQYAISHLPIRFHTDAVQAAGYLNCNTKYLHVDLLTLSGHKLGTPKGIGALFIKKGTPIEPQITGGEHEYKKRAGTENVPGIVAVGEAVKLAKNGRETAKIKKLRDYLEKQIAIKIPDVQINGHPKERLPNISNLNFKYVEGESILLNLDLKGIAASSGSACTSGSLEPSHVIMAIYNDPLKAHGSIRFSLGWDTNKKELDYVIKVLPGIIKKLRKISPYGKK